MKKGVLRNFTKFTGKHLCQNLLKFLGTLFFTVHLRKTASEFYSPFLFQTNFRLQLLQKAFITISYTTVEQEKFGII